MVVLPKEEFDRLLDAREMLEDVAAYDRFKARLAAGEEELAPAEIADRLLTGENPIRVWRERRSLKATELAGAAGVSAAVPFPSAKPVPPARVISHFDVRRPGAPQMSCCAVDDSDLSG